MTNRSKYNWSAKTHGKKVESARGGRREMKERKERRDRKEKKEGKRTMGQVEIALMN